MSSLRMTKIDKILSEFIEALEFLAFIGRKEFIAFIAFIEPFFAVVFTIANPKRPHAPLSSRLSKTFLNKSPPSIYSATSRLPWIDSL